MDDSSVSSILTLEQAADYLHVTVEELRAELESGHIPGLKVAGHWRIKRQALDRLLDSTASADKEAGVLTASPDANSEKPRSSQVEAVLVQTELEGGRDAVTAKADYAEDDVPPPLQQPLSPLTPPPGRLWAHVFAYNPKKGVGYARLPDNRVVWLDSHDLVQRDTALFPGDTVEFALEHSQKGLEGRTIRIISKGDGHLAAEPVKARIVTPDKGRQPELTPSSAVLHQPITPAPKAPIPPGGTSKSQQLYQKAAVARAEGRYDEARRLFRQAIEAGAGTQVYSAFFKLEMEKGFRAEARQIIQDAIAQFPTHVPFYEMYGHMERRARDYLRAEEIFRKGLLLSPTNIGLRRGLAQTLVQIGTEKSLQEAARIFGELEKVGRFDRRDPYYQRSQVFQRSPRANKAFDFLRAANMLVGIVKQRDLPPHIADIVAETNDQELNESFGLSGAFLVRCFQRSPRPIEILDLCKFLRKTGPQGVLGLQDHEEVVLNPAVAFIAVPNIEAVRDQVMSILSDNNEAIVPLDDALFQNSEKPLQALRDLLGQYLGLRDLYSSTLPVSGRRFFGRERLLLQLTDEVHRGQFLGIYGLRKIGKTSLIYQLRDEKLRGEAVAYADLQASAALTTKNCDPLYWEFERDLYLRLRERNQEAADLLRLGKVERFSDLPENGSRAGLLFAEDLRAFLDALSTSKISGIRRIVIVLDELERILPVAGQPGINGYVEFFGLLRGLAQTERYRGLLSSVVVAANATISERGYWEGRENPVFALYKPVFLPPLSEVECVEMIRSLGKGMSVYWDDDATSAVFAETGGHPFLTRALCSRIAKQNLTRPLKVTAQMVQAQIGPFIRDESDKLEQITELLRTNFPEEETFLQQIALGEAQSEMPDEALRHLLGYHLIAAEDSGYRVTLNLLRRWLRRRAGIRERVCYAARRLYDTERTKEIASDFDLLETYCDQLAQIVTGAYSGASGLTHTTATRERAYRALKQWESILAQLLPDT